MAKQLVVMLDVQKINHNFVVVFGLIQFKKLQQFIEKRENMLKEVKNIPKKVKKLLKELKIL